METKLVHENGEEVQKWLKIHSNFKVEFNFFTPKLNNNSLVASLVLYFLHMKNIIIHEKSKETIFYL